MITGWLGKSIEERREILANVAPQMGIALANVEKDFWLTFVLSKIFSFPNAKETFVFGGGSSLSKAYNLIERFSEDIDLAIIHKALGFKGDLSRHQINHQLRDKSYSFVNNDLHAHLLRETHGLPCKVSVIKAPVPTLSVEYKPVVPSTSYNLPSIKIEAGGRFASQPSEIQTITTLVDPTISISIPSLLPQSIILQKIFLLHEGIVLFPDKFKTLRSSRHLYDVMKVWKSGQAQEILKPDFYKKIATQRCKYHYRQLTLDSFHPSKITIVPEGEIKDKLKDDYKLMSDVMIYDKSAPKFVNLLKELEVIQSQIRKIQF